VASEWSVRLTAEAQSGLDELLEQESEECYRDGLQAIGDLVENPTPAGSVRMRKAKDYYRLYICHRRWRVIYRVFFSQRSILVHRVGPRPTVYSGFDRW